MRFDIMKEIKLAITTVISSQISEIAISMATQIKAAINTEMSTTTKGQYDHVASGTRGRLRRNEATGNGQNETKIHFKHIRFLHDMWQ